MRIYGESKTTRIMMATVRHVTAWAGRTKYQANRFLLDGVYIKNSNNKTHRLDLTQSNKENTNQKCEKLPTSPCSPPHISSSMYQ